MCDERTTINGVQIFIENIFNNLLRARNSVEKKINLNRPIDLIG